MQLNGGTGWISYDIGTYWRYVIRKPDTDIKKSVFLPRIQISGLRRIHVAIAAAIIFWTTGNIFVLSNTLLYYVWIIYRSQTHTIQLGRPLLCIVRGFLTKLFQWDSRFGELGFAIQEASCRKENSTPSSPSKARYVLDVLTNDCACFHMSLERHEPVSLTPFFRKLATDILYNPA